MDLARLTVRLEAQSAQLLSELEKANKKIDRFAGSTQSTLKNWAGVVAAAFSVSAIVSFTKGVLDAHEQMNDLASATNLSVETLSGLGYAASQSGSSLDALGSALQRLASKSADVAAGSASAKAAFDAIGVSALKVDGTLKTTDQLLLDVADGFAAHADGAAKAAVAQDIFGKGGEKLIQFLNQGRAGIEELTAKAAKLGLVMSTETAVAADEFGDNLATLGSVLSANVGAALLKVLPMLVSVTNAIIEAISTGDGVARFATAVTTGFRLIVDIGYSVWKTFEDIGRGFGALAAYVAKVATGQFAEARDISKQYDLDRIASTEAANKFLKDLWDDTGKNIVAVAEETDAALKKTIMFGGKSGGELQEVEIKLKKIDTKPIEDYYKHLHEQTKTQSERQIDAYNSDLTALKVLLATGEIEVEKYNERLAEIQETFLPEFEVTLKKVSEVAEKAVTELSEFQKQAARNTQDIIADTLTGMVTGADISAKSILKSFADMIIKLTAQAVAADLAGKLFGEAGGGTKGSSGWIGIAMSAIGAYGGTKDSGGRGMPGMEYLIGTGAQPERFVPDRPGTFIPAGSGGTSVTNHFTVQTEQPVTRRTQMQIAAAASRGVSRANRRNN